MSNEIDVSLITGSSQQIGIGIAQITQGIGIDVESGGLAFVHHDETLIGDGTIPNPLGVNTEEFIQPEELKEALQTFVFEMAIASADWEIQHNLDRYPSIDVVDSAGSLISIYDAEIVDSNKIIIHFGAPFTGKAYLN